jgi:hypothetical protein
VGPTRPSIRHAAKNDRLDLTQTARSALHLLHE